MRTKMCPPDLFSPIHADVSRLLDCVSNGYMTEKSVHGVVASVCHSQSHLMRRNSSPAVCGLCSVPARLGRNFKLLWRRAPVLSSVDALR